MLPGKSEWVFSPQIIKLQAESPESWIRRRNACSQATCAWDHAILREPLKIRETGAVLQFQEQSGAMVEIRPPGVSRPLKSRDLPPAKSSRQKSIVVFRIFCGSALERKYEWRDHADTDLVKGWFNFKMKQKDKEVKCLASPWSNSGAIC